MKIRCISLIIVFFSIMSCKQEIPQEDYAPEYKMIFKIRTDHFKNLPKSTGKTVFIGHSLIQYGNWDEVLPDYKIINRGIGGSTIEMMTEVINSELKSKPKKMFIMIGVNDMGKDVENIKSDYSKLFESVKMYPKTDIYYLSILPNSYMKKNIDIANSHVKMLCSTSNIKYIDLNQAFSDKNGFLKKELTIDDVHLSGKGYLKLAEILTPYLK